MPHLYNGVMTVEVENGELIITNQLSNAKIKITARDDKISVSSANENPKNVELDQWTHPFQYTFSNSEADRCKYLEERLSHFKDQKTV